MTKCQSFASDLAAPGTVYSVSIYASFWAIYGSHEEWNLLRNDSVCLLLLPSLAQEFFGAFKMSHVSCLLQKEPLGSVHRRWHYAYADLALHNLSWRCYRTRKSNFVSHLNTSRQIQGREYIFKGISGFLKTSNIGHHNIARCRESAAPHWQCQEALDVENWFWSRG